MHFSNEVVSFQVHWLIGLSRGSKCANGAMNEWTWSRDIARALLGHEWAMLIIRASSVRPDFFPSTTATSREEKPQFAVRRRMHNKWAQRADARITIFVSPRPHLYAPPHPRQSPPPLAHTRSCLGKKISKRRPIVACNIKCSILCKFKSVEQNVIWKSPVL